ncbi:hypothetical protein LTR46_000608 [Exophiala xenobiotica]|nr:hypothetical protein LTR46_000608 [Exophiala xenobiotica]
MFQFSAADPHDEVHIDRRRAPSTSKDHRRQITRNRISYSCVTCRRRKVKCDKAHPVCGGCKRANEHCLYSEDTKAADSVTGPPNDETTDGSKKRKSSVVRPPATLAQVSGISQDSSVPPPPQLKAIEEQLLRLTSMVDALRQSGGNDLHFRTLLTPVPSNSDHDSDEIVPRSDLSLNMFQSRNSGSPQDVNDLSRPLSGLKLSNGHSKNPEDPFWMHISDELDQLNHMMRRHKNSNVGTTSSQRKACDSPEVWTQAAKADPTLGKDDFWEPISFQKEAAPAGLATYDPDSDCSICRKVPFAKSSLLQTLPVQCSHAAAWHHLLEAFPTRAQSNVLLRCWLSSTYPILPIFIPSEILAKHEKLWDRIETTGISQLKTQYPDVELYATIYAVWYAGVLSLSSKGLQRWFPGTTRAQLASQYHEHVVFLLHLGSFMRNATLQKLATLILLQSLPVAEEDPIQGSLYMQLNVRLALMMGLHREPTLFDLPVSEEGMRRRLWWQLVQLDTSLVIASGYPTLISEAYSDTRINCEDHDAFVADNEEGSSAHSKKHSNPFSWGEAHSAGENGNLTLHRTMGLVARARSITACALRTIVAVHLGTKMLTHADMQEMKRVMSDAGGQIDEIITQIPAKGLPELAFVPDGPGRGHQQYTLDCDSVMSSPVTDKDVAYYKTYVSNEDLASPLTRYHRQKLAAFNKWARITLSMLKDKISCVAYAPFLKNAKSKLWSAGRQCALHNCHSFLRKFISLAQDPDLETFRWTWPAMHGPMHAALIVLVDLYERPDSVEAPRSRELVDTVFSLSDPQVGIVGGPNGVTAQRPLREGGVEPWDMLRGLRSAAWQRAGLDPNVLWTEADQLDVGVATPLTDAQKVAQSLREDTVYESGHGQSHHPHPDPGITSSSTTTTTSQHPEKESQSSEKGVRYMVKLTQTELAGGAGGGGRIQEPKSEGFPCLREMRNRFLEGIEKTGDRSNHGGGRGRILARAREGQQQRMPFPLSGCMEQCSRAAANGDLPPHVPQDIGRPAIRPMAAETAFCPSQLGRSQSSGPAAATASHGGVRDAATRHDEATATTTATAQHNGHAATNGYGRAVTDQQVQSVQNHHAHQVNGHGRETNGVGGREQNGFNDHILPPSSDVHGDSNAPLQDDGFTTATAAAATDIGFDWARWDSVFGQYTGFTDMMEDVTWSLESYADE